MHPSGLNERIIAKVLTRRGRVHAFEGLTPDKSCLVVIDMNKASVEQDNNCGRTVPRINAVATALRSSGGLVAWVTTKFLSDATATAIFGEATARRFAAETAGLQGELYPELSVHSRDMRATKSGASAFFPGKCNLHEQLIERGIESLLVAGTVTNVCVESSARDAAELGYHVTLISDACAGHAHGLHEATLNTFYRAFGDVRTTDDAIDLIRKAGLRS